MRTRETAWEGRRRPAPVLKGAAAVPEPGAWRGGGPSGDDPAPAPSSSPGANLPLRAARAWSASSPPAGPGCAAALRRRHLELQGAEAARLAQLRPPPKEPHLEVGALRRRPELPREARPEQPPWSSPRPGGPRGQRPGAAGSPQPPAGRRPREPGRGGSPAAKTPPWPGPLLPAAATFLSLHPPCSLCLFFRRMFSVSSCFFFFFLPHKTPTSRADHGLEPGSGFPRLLLFARAQCEAREASPALARGAGEVWPGTAPGSSVVAQEAGDAQITNGEGSGAGEQKGAAWPEEAQGDRQNRSSTPDDHSVVEASPASLRAASPGLRVLLTRQL
ncbi:uncharacterized protein LOC132656540 [Meriones unguiculatus]|uniref:uncharacterized protein LOC132656540 n=1 Tax=Meriones unguiculatus TaxID=10047 RepID=UPI00293E8E4B|nr:uncharacterized protein LOC132656540 [Meriones unguiculatus]